MKYLSLLVKKFFKGPWYDWATRSYYNYYSDGTQSYYSFSSQDRNWYDFYENSSSEQTVDEKTGKKLPYTIGYKNL